MKYNTRTQSNINRRNKLMIDTTSLTGAMCTDLHYSLTHWDIHLQDISQLMNLYGQSHILLAL